MDTTVRSSTANLSKKQIYDVFDETAKLFEQFGSNFKEKKRSITPKQVNQIAY